MLRRVMRKYFLMGVVPAIKAVCVLALLNSVHLGYLFGQVQSDSPVPKLIQFSGILKDGLGRPLTGVQGITFALYQEQNGGEALWLETQNVTADDQGRYTALLGITQPGGLPIELFSSGRARWLGVRINQPDQLEQPRIQLLSVPYVLKAADSETLGGKPVSAFVSPNPVNTQTITAPNIPGAIPLRIMGSPLASASLLEVYDSQSRPQLQSFFDKNGSLWTKRPSAFGSEATIDDRTILNSVHRFSSNSSTIYSAVRGSAIADATAPEPNITYAGVFGIARVPNNNRTFFGNTAVVLGVASEATYEGSGDFGQVVGADVSAYHAGSGSVDVVSGVDSVYGLFGSGNVNNMYGVRTYAGLLSTGDVGNHYSFYAYNPRKRGDNTIGSNYGLFIESQTAGTNNWAIWTGAGKVHFGDTVQAEKSFSAGIVTVPFSTNPNFDATLGNSFRMTLTGDVTVATLSNAQAGQQINFLICQDGTGRRTFAWPSSVRGGGRISGTPNTCSAQTFLYDGSNAYALGELKGGM